MKVVAMPEVYFYDLSLRKAMDAARFFSLGDLSLLSLLHVTDFFGLFFMYRSLEYVKNRHAYVM